MQLISSLNAILTLTSQNCRSFPVIGTLSLFEGMYAIIEQRLLSSYEKCSSVYETLDDRFYNEVLHLLLSASLFRSDKKKTNFLFFPKLLPLHTRIGN